MGFRESRQRGKTFWLGINASGCIYERSDEPKEGFSEHINPMTNQPSGYRKEYYNGMSGYMNYIGLKSRPNKQGIAVEYFVLIFKDYELDENYTFLFPIVTPKGGLHRYVKSFVKYYPNLDISRLLVFNAFKKKAEDEYAPSNLSFCYVTDDKDEYIPMYYKTGINGWPDAEETTGFGGKVTRSYQKQDAFAYEELKRFIEDFNAKIGPIRKELELKYGKAPARSAEESSAPAAPPSFSNPATPATPAAPAFKAGPAPQAPAGGFEGAPAAPSFTGQPTQPSATVPPLEEDEDLPF